MGPLARVPIRLRLTLAFALAMAVVLSATGLFLYLRLGAELEGATDRNLRSRTDDVVALLRQPGEGNRLGELAGLAQVLGPEDGEVLHSTPQLGERPLLTPAEVSRARAGRMSFERPSVPGSDDPAKLLATPMTVAGGRLVVIVRAS